MAESRALRNIVVVALMMMVAILVGPGLIGISHAQVAAAGEGWVETATMNAYRSGHAMVTLADGRIMAIGGYDRVFTSGSSQVALRSVEIYDPAPGTWAPAAGMNVARSHFFAVRLADGKVLVAGGRETDTSEIYDPFTDTWILTGPLPRRHSAGQSNTNSALLLGDGRVMIAGGFESVGLRSSVSTAAGTYPAYLVSNGITAGLVGTLVDCGQGLAGQFPVAVSGNIALVRQGGGSGFRQKTVAAMAAGATATIHVPYPSPWQGDPDRAIPPTDFGAFGSSNSGTPWIPALSVSYNTGAALLSQAGQSATLVGIAQPTNLATSASELYDPLTGTWAPGAPMSGPRVAHTLTLLPNGTVLAVGGRSSESTFVFKNTGPQMLASAEVYDPATNAWTAIPPMPAVSDVVGCSLPPGSSACAGDDVPMAARSHHTADLLPTNKVLVVGGYGSYIRNSTNDNISARASCLLLDLATMTWSQTSGMGVGTTDGGRCEMFPALLGRAGHASFRTADGAVVIAGGVNNSQSWNSTRVTQRYDPSTETWSRLGDLPTWESDWDCPSSAPLVGFMAPRVVGASNETGTVLLAGRGGGTDNWLGAGTYYLGGYLEGSHEGQNRAFRLVPDPEGDGLSGTDDNCPLHYNPSQEDADQDGRGDICDNCVSASNPTQSNWDGDSRGDACDNCASWWNDDQVDGDGDGKGDLCDNCAGVSNPGQEDLDGDSAGDACDNCPSVGNSQEDYDWDGTGDACDNCEWVSNPQQEDFDHDGAGDYCDDDDDNDGVQDPQDRCPLAARQGVDYDADGCTDTIAGLMEDTVWIETNMGWMYGERNFWNGLYAKLNEAQKALDRGNTRAAERNLHDYIDQVTNVLGTDGWGGYLVAYAQGLITLIRQ